MENGENMNESRREGEGLDISRLIWPECPFQVGLNSLGQVSLPYLGTLAI